MRIAMVGTRGVPAAYGGFETAVEEIGQRLVASGHQIMVYCRTTGDDQPKKEHLGMSLVHLPAVRSKTLETLSHTFLSILHLVVHQRPDMVFLFNAANSPFLPLLRMFRIPVAVHVDGLEWKRGKWGKTGRRYYKVAEQLAVQWADALIADAQGIADYYTEKFQTDTDLITYGTKIITDPAADRIAELGLTAGQYHLVVARFEPENHVDVIVDGYSASDAKLPLVVVGSAPYSAEYTDRIAAVAAADPRIRMLGGVWDQELLDQLYANALTYLHGHSVGGTNPSLLRAMGAGTSVIAWDVNFNREVVSEAAYFSSPSDVTALVNEAEAEPEWHHRHGAALRVRAAAVYNWETVTDGYEQLANRLAHGHTVPATRTGEPTTADRHLAAAGTQRERYVA